MDGQIDGEAPKRPTGAKFEGKEPHMKNLAEVFRARIDETGMKDKAVAERAGLDPNILSAMLNGRRRILATDFISLCRVLDLTVSDFEPEKGIEE